MNDEQKENDILKEHTEQTNEENSSKEPVKPKSTYTPLSNKQAFLIRSIVFAILGTIILVFWLVKKFG